MSEARTEARQIDVVTIGESMMLFQTLQEGRLAYAPLFTRSVAGAESNVAIGLTRQGKKVRWISRLGDDPFGDHIVSVLRGEGLDVQFVQRDPDYPTAIYFKQNIGSGDPSVYYYRKGSAASRFAPGDVKAEWFAGAGHLHVTGITPALGPHTADMIELAMRTARSMGLTVSFDPNIRLKLWDRQTAKQTLLRLVPLADIFMPGLEEAEFLLGPGSPEDLAAQFADSGPRIVVIKLGAEGSMGFCEGRAYRVAGFPVAHVVDTVGAGDAFAAGFLSVMLGADFSAAAPSLQEALKKGNLMGAMATQYRGDWEGLPTLQEAEAALAGRQEVKR